MDSVVIGISALLFLLPVPGSSQYLDGRCGLLTNGKIANNISSPWMAYLHTSELLYVCGGTVITESSSMQSTSLIPVTFCLILQN